MRKKKLFVFLLLSALCLQAQTKEKKLNATEMFTSSITNTTYQVDIYVPESYEKSTSKYPIIYATDGQWVFEGFSKIVRETNKEVILVAIHQGPENRRLVDYLVPRFREYYRFLIAELLPYIEDKYRADTTNRTLAGTSAGGMLVGSVMLIEDPEKPHFTKYLSVDAPFTTYGHKMTTWALENERFKTSKKMKVTLFLSGALAKGDLGPFDEDVTRFEKLLRSRKYDGLKIIRKSYDVDHYNIANPSFRDFLTQLF
ncbi:esterase family protein [Maribacter sp.]|nr:esterase family protein [Maribacter sp.]